MTQTTKPTNIEFVGADAQYVFGNNTFRRGDKYADLRPGEVLIGTGETNFQEQGLPFVIRKIAVGTLEELLQSYSSDNHAAIELTKRGILASNPFAARNAVLEALESAYGELERNEIFTVIYFYSIDEAEELLGSIDEEEIEQDTETE